MLRGGAGWGEKRRSDTLPNSLPAAGLCAGRAGPASSGNLLAEGGELLLVGDGFGVVPLCRHWYQL